MAPLVPASRGFTADVRHYSKAISPKHNHGRIAVIVIIGLALVLAVQMIPSKSDSEQIDMAKTTPASSGSTYLWRVYVLNQTTRNVGANGTTFVFKLADLPLDFASLQFGDFRADSQYVRTYYGGCGILVNGSGTNANITLREVNGKLVSSISYSGQNPIVFSGERKSVSYPSSVTTYSGTEKLIQDWRNGTWNPGQGILIEHPMGLTLARSDFCLMVFEPSGPTEIPEFDLILVGVVTCIVVVSIGRAKR